MAQATVLTSGTTAEQSDAIVVLQGQPVTVGIFSEEPLPATTRCAISIKGPTGSQVVGWLNGDTVATTITAAGTYFVTRPVVEVAVGIFTEA